MKSCITTLLKDNSDGLSLKDLRKKVVKQYLTQHSDTEMQPKRKQEAKALYDDEVKKLTEKLKILIEGDVVRLNQSSSEKKEKKEKDDKKGKKDKKDKKRKRDAGGDDEAEIVVEPKKVKQSTKNAEKESKVDLKQTPEVSVTTPVVPVVAVVPQKKKQGGSGDAPKSEAKKTKTRKEKSEKVGFNVEAVPKTDINPLTGKKLKKRSKEAYERRKARFLNVKNLDSRNKRAQAEFGANKKWLNSASTGTNTSTTTAAEPAPTYTSF